MFHLYACTYIIYVCVSVESWKGDKFFSVLKVWLPLSYKCSCVNGLLSFNEPFTELFQYQNYMQSSKFSYWNSVDVDEIFDTQHRCQNKKEEHRIIKVVSVLLFLKLSHVLFKSLKNVVFHVMAWQFVNLFLSCYFS
jgi:hypothetical protein